ncbi:MAG: glycosyltransferase family 1 protein [Cyanobacteria bacterium P01_F01_bin.150]
MSYKSFSDKTIYFYCISPESVHNAAYHHLAICIAEGLKELGIKFYSNINYWRLSLSDDEFLFQHDPNVGPDDCSVVVVSMQWFARQQPFPHHLFKRSRTYSTVYLDREDGLETMSWQPDFKKFDFILKTHYSQKHSYPFNAYPWAFGITNRITREAARATLDFGDRDAKILLNFRDKRNPHTVRRNVYRNFGPKFSNSFAVDRTIDTLNTPPPGELEHLFWFQTGKRHNPNYYNRLGQSQACACFGGYFVSPWPRDKGNRLSFLQERIIAKLNLTTRFISQWDSWRLWESFASECVTFHLDFERYGLTLPVMPENWKHYVGVDLQRPEEAIEKFVERIESLGEIGRSGKEWAYKHYSPVPTAKRFLELTCA